MGLLVGNGSAGVSADLQAVGGEDAAAAVDGEAGAGGEVVDAQEFDRVGDRRGGSNPADQRRGGELIGGLSVDVVGQKHGAGADTIDSDGSMQPRKFDGQRTGHAFDRGLRGKVRGVVDVGAARGPVAEIDNRPAEGVARHCTGGRAG